MADKSAPKCNYCSKTRSTSGVALSRCGKCQTTLYCSRECQTADWKGHKRVCAPVTSPPLSQPPGGLTDPAIEASLKPNANIVTDSQCITCNGHVIMLTALRAWVNNLIEDATDILFKELLFSSRTTLSDMSIDSLTDDMAISRSGHSFLDDPDNVSVLDKYRTDPVRNLEAQPGGGLMVNYPDIIVDSLEELRNMNRHTMKKTFTPFAAEAYNNSAMQFLELLLVIILMAGGLPPYGNDLLHVQVVNDEHSRRGIYIRGGGVEIVTSNGHPTSPRPALRFMPDVVGKLIVLYLENVLPRTKQKENKFLFASSNGRGCWSRGKYEKILERETVKGLDVKLGVDGLKALHLEVSRIIAPGILDDDGYIID